MLPPFKGKSKHKEPGKTLPSEETIHQRKIEISREISHTQKVYLGGRNRLSGKAQVIFSFQHYFFIL